MNEQQLLDTINAYTSQAPSCLSIGLPSYEAQKAALRNVHVTTHSPEQVAAIKAYMKAGTDLDYALKVVQYALTTFIEHKAAVNTTLPQ